MLRIAIAGNIASGKSEVEKFLKQTGYKLLDTDLVAHEILQKEPIIKEAFKDFDVLDNGEISREKLGKLVFSDKNLLKKLESLTHPIIKTKINEFFADNSAEKFVFVAIPLLFEAKMEDLFDKIVFVTANDELRLERLISRNGYDREYALKRLNSQAPQTDKITKSDYIIENNGTLEDLKEQIHHILAEL